MKKVLAIACLLLILTFVFAVAASAQTEGNWRFYLQPDDGSGGSSMGKLTIGVNTATATKDGFGAIDGTGSDGQDVRASIPAPNTSAFAAGIFNNMAWINDVKNARVPQSPQYGSGMAANNITPTVGNTYGAYPYEPNRKIWDIRVGGLGGFAANAIRLQFLTVSAGAGLPPATLPYIWNSQTYQGPAKYWLRMVNNRGISGAPDNGTVWSIPIPTAHSSVAYYSLTLPSLNISVKDEAHVISEGYAMQFFQTPEPSSLLALGAGLLGLAGFASRRRRS